MVTCASREQRITTKRACKAHKFVRRLCCNEFYIYTSLVTCFIKLFCDEKEYIDINEELDLLFKVTSVLPYTTFFLLSDYACYCSYPGNNDSFGNCSCQGKNEQSYRRGEYFLVTLHIKPFNLVCI